MAEFTQADIDNIKTAFDINGQKQNNEIKAALSDILTDKTNVKVYIATLTQTGTNAPVATVLENTLGVVPVWSYYDVGSYFLTAASVFTAGRTTVLNNNPTQDYGGQAKAYVGDPDRVWIDSTNDVFTPVDDNFFKPVTIEIKVYS